MSKILETFIERGSNLWSKGSGGAFTFVKTKYGYLNIATNTINSTPLVLPDKCTFVMEGIIGRPHSDYIVHVLDASAINRIRFEYSQFYIQFNSNSISVSPAIDGGTWFGKPFVFSVSVDFISHTYSTIIYKSDGIIKQSGVNANIVKPAIEVFQGYCQVYNPVKKSFHRKFIVYDEIVKESVVKDLYLDFLNSKSINKPTVFQPNLNIFKPSEVRELGLIAAYNFNPINGKLLNVAWDNPANGNNARSYNVTCKGSGIQLLPNGVKIKGGKPNISTLPFDTPLNLGSTYSICLIINSDFTASDYFLGYYNQNTVRLINGTVQHYALLNTNSSGTITFSWNVTLVPNTTNTIVLVRTIGTCALYVNGKLIGISTGTGTASAQFLLNNFVAVDPQSYAYLATWENTKIYNRALAAPEIKNYHNQYASKVVLYEDFSQYAVGNFPRSWFKNSGTVAVSEQSSKSQVNIGTKNLAITSTANFSVLSTTRSGTWEFDGILYKNSAIQIYLSTPNKTGTYSGGADYDLLSGNTGQFVFRRVGFTTYYSSPLNVFTDGKYYDIKITKTVAGLTTLYYRLTGSVTWLLMPILTGTNPFTIDFIPKYLVFNFGTGSKLTSLKITQGVTI